MTQQTKQTLKTTVFFIGAFIAIMAIFIIDGIRVDIRMNAYAEEHNCTWHATGTWYGDDRDFICK